MRPRVLLLAVAVIVALSAVPVFAQYESSDKSPIGIGVGFYRPSSSYLRDLDSNWVGPTVSYQMRFDRSDRPDLLFSIGWFSKTEDSTDESARFVPIRVTAIKRFGTEDSCWYVGGGLDCFFTHFQGGRYYESTDGTKFGVNLCVGTELGSGWFAELQDDMVSKLSYGNTNIDFSGLTLSFGTRFAY
jgi:hypothetical protein